ncbi:hypothetical protein KXS11_15225 [Plantibacter flavus]|uniref:hypothetical protein n=1 Tax=Plantibacter flavus TaxID=150123 RepID=UPI003F15850F
MDEQAVYERLLASRPGADTSRGRLFSALSFIVHGHSVGCIMRGTAAFKLGRETPELAAALAAPGAELFDPSGRGRPFKDWVVLPLSEEPRFEQLLEQAVAFALA